MLVREEQGVKVICVDNIHPENAAMAQALYARSPASAEVHLRKLENAQREAFREVLKLSDIRDYDSVLDSVMAVAGNNDASAEARKLNQTYAVNYGHLSILDCGSTYLFIEGISELACKALQHSGLFSGQQTSTRAVDVSQQRIVDPIGTPASKAVLERWMRFYTSSQERVAEEVRRRYPRRPRVTETVACRDCEGSGKNPLAGSPYDSPYDDGTCRECKGTGRSDEVCIVEEGEDEKTYASAVKMRVFDILRGFLPAGLTTQTSMAMNLRQLSDHLTWLLVHPLEEVRRVGRLIQGILRERYPSSGSFGGSAALSGIGTKGASPEEAAARDAWVAATAEAWTYHDPHMRPGRANRPDALEHGEFSTTIDLGVLQLPNIAAVLKTRPRGCVLPRVLDDEGTCTASFLLDWGAWRDIERQRAGTCRVPMLTMEYGFEPWYLDQLPGVEEGLTRRRPGEPDRTLPSSYSGLALEALQLIAEQAKAIEALTEDPLLRQYYTPFGFRVPTTLTYTLPIWAYVLELRTGPTVHPSLRAAMLGVVREFEETFGDAVPLHIDRRLDAWTIRRGAQTIERRAAPDQERRAAPDKASS